MYNKTNNILYLAGNKNIKKIINEPFCKSVVDFLDELSKIIFKKKKF